MSDIVVIVFILSAVIVASSLLVIVLDNWAERKAQSMHENYLDWCEREYDTMSYQDFLDECFPAAEDD